MKGMSRLPNSNFLGLNVHCATTPGPLFKKGTHLIKVLLNGVIVDEAVVNTVLHVLTVCHYLCLPVGVSIASTDKTLGAGTVAITAPRSDKGCKVSVSWVEGNTVITMPAIYS